MKYLESYVMVWKLTDRAYKRFLRDVAAGKPWDVNDYGKMFHTIDQNITDFDADQAKGLLEYGKD